MSLRNSFEFCGNPPCYKSRLKENPKRPTGIYGLRGGIYVCSTHRYDLSDAT